MSKKGVADVRLGSWLCENSVTRNRDRTNISSKPRVQCAKIESVFSSDLSEKNILVAFQFFAFLHTQVIRDRVEPAAGQPCPLLLRSLPKNRALPKRREGPTDSRAATITSSVRTRASRARNCPARTAKKVLAYEAE